MKYLNLLFHIYQPPVQDNEVTHTITEESYRPLARSFVDFQDLKCTLNINLSLTEKLATLETDVIANIKKAYEHGNLELTDSGAYHPIFPLIPFDEIKRQLQLNRVGNQQHISPKFKPTGIFPPEMAFEARHAPLFKEMGYEWTITDDGNLGYYGIEAPYNKIYCCEGFGVLLRSNHWSNKFAHFKQGQWKSAREFVEELDTGLEQWMGNNDGYVIIGLDGETFGHHHPELGKDFLPEMFEVLREYKHRIQLATLSEIFNRFPKTPQFIPPTSWSTDRVNIEQKDYFSWWKSHQNKIHTLQWEFTNLVLEKVRGIVNEDINKEMDKALYSCQYWWACFWKFNPGEIYKGAFNMMKILQHAAELLNNNYELIKEGEDIFKQLILEIKKEEHARRHSHG